MKATKQTNCFVARVFVCLISISLALLVSLPGPIQTSLARAQGSSASGAGQAQSQELARPTTPLERLLNRDGTLKLNTGFTGSVDPSGWEMTTGPGGQPRFLQTQGQAGSHQLKTQDLRAPIVPGDENWDDRFFLPGLNGNVYAIAISGSNLYLGGYFTLAGRASASNIARWDGSQWYALGSGVNDMVRAIAISGNDVYVGGLFTTAGGIAANHIARWDTNSSQWNALGSGVGSSQSDHVSVIAISGNDVYVGGLFTTAGGIAANHIARWDTNNSQWHTLGSGVGPGGNGGVCTFAFNGNDSVCAIAINGSDVYVGGTFTTAGGVTVNNIARWDTNSSQWSALGSGVTFFGSGGSVNAIAISGSDIYVAGGFGTAGGLSARNIARWNTNSSQWFPLGSGTNNGLSGESADAIAILGNDVYVGGLFNTAGGVNANGIARWDGNQWHALGGGTGTGGASGGVSAITVSGGDVYVGGGFHVSDGVGANYLARWDTNSSQWNVVGVAAARGVSRSVYAIAISGNDVYVGGFFSTVGSVSANNIARWDGSQWHALGGGVSLEVDAIAISGSDVYVGGNFERAGGILANSIARWDSASSQWYPMGSGMDNNLSGYVYSIVISGSNVYAGGRFTTAGGTSASNVARWDTNSSQWYPLGGGVGRAGIDIVEALAMNGNDLYVGGYLATAGGISINNIARWDGSQWYALGSGAGSAGGYDFVGSIVVKGGDVYAGGRFITAGGITVNNIARWDTNSSQWFPLGSGMSGGEYGNVLALASNGGDLYAGGYFIIVGGVNANHIARWDGNQWYPLGSGAGSAANGAVVGIVASGLDIFTGGNFTVAGNKPSFHLGIWHDPGLVAHMTWQGRPSQPDTRLQLPITLTLKSGTVERNYPSQSTSASAYFTTGVGTLAAGTYNWRAKNPKYLASSGTVTLIGDPITELDMGLMRAGDANDDNIVNAGDFNILKVTYGKGIGDPGYDERADFNGDNIVNVSDFNLLKVNFGLGGAPPIAPGGR